MTINTNSPNKEEVVAENTTAMDTLKPGNGSSSVGSDPKSKVEYITQMIGAMHTMKKTELTKWFDDAMKLIGKEAKELPSGANETSNEITIRAKDSKANVPSHNNPIIKIAPITPGQSMKEDVAALFEGQENLSEEFVEKASNIFEAAVTLRAITEVARLEEEFATKLEESVEEIREDIQSKLDTYLDYVVESWMKENEVAIESTLRSEVMEDFIGGLKKLFTEHYIEVPDDKVDVIESLTSKVTELEEKLNEVIVENVELKQDGLISKKSDLIESLTEGLTLSDSEKFVKLAEGLEFDGDLNKFESKLAVVKETYFTNKKVGPKSNIEEEVFEGIPDTNTSVIDPEINSYVQAISRSVKK
jgi:hypothetical protein